MYYLPILAKLKTQSIFNPTKGIKNLDNLAMELIADTEDDHFWILQKYDGKPLADKICSIYAYLPMIKSLNTHELNKLKDFIIRFTNPANQLRKVAHQLKRL